MTIGRERLVLLRNAVANVGRGSTAALVALLLPPFLTRLMAPTSFGAWVLVLQMSAYVGYLDFGIQTAVGRFVAHANERQDPEHRDRIVSSSLAILAVSGLLAWIGIAVLAIFLPYLFKQLPLELVFQVRAAFVLVGASLAVGLPASVFIGVFVGMQQNTTPATIIGVSKIVSAVVVVFIVKHGGNLVTMALAVAAINLLSYIFHYYAYVRLAPTMRIAFRLVTRATAKELLDYCFSLTIWSLGLLFVTGLDLTIVGHYRFNEVGYYSVASVIVTFLGGFYNAIISPMTPAAAVLHARGDSRQLGQMVMVATRYGMLLLLVTGLPLIAGAHFFLRVWVGLEYSTHATSIAQLLIVANLIRLCITPYVVAMIGSGEQRLVILTPLLEGVSNLVCSLIFGYFLGALGVAIGTFIGSIVGVSGMFFYNMRRTTAIHLAAGEYFGASILRPCICAIPIIIFTMLPVLGLPLNQLTENMMCFAAIAVTASLMWKFGLLPGERRNLRHRVLSIIH